MMTLIELFLMLGTFLAAGAVCIVCGLGLLVWVAGRRKHLFKAD